MTRRRRWWRWRRASGSMINGCVWNHIAALTLIKCWSVDSAVKIWGSSLNLKPSAPTTLKHETEPRHSADADSNQTMSDVSWHECLWLNKPQKLSRVFWSGLCSSSFTSCVVLVSFWLFIFMFCVFNLEISISGADDPHEQRRPDHLDVWRLNSLWRADDSLQVLHCYKSINCNWWLWDSQTCLTCSWPGGENPSSTFNIWQQVVEGRT